MEIRFDANPSHFKGDNLPVETISWHDAMEFCRRLNMEHLRNLNVPDGYIFRPPTEAEWEYACRAGSSKKYQIGDTLDDLAFVSYDRQPQPYPDKGYNPNLPSLIVEVISSDTAAEHRNLRIKVSNYLAAGIEVWVVDPTEKLIEVHRQGEPTHLYRPSDLLTSTIFPGFEMVVEAIFAYGPSDDE
jgi:hypothetical protein